MNMASPPSRSAPPLGAASPPGVTSTPTEQARHRLWSTSQTDERGGQGSGQGGSSSVRAMSTTANALPPTYANTAQSHAAPAVRQHTKGLVGALNDEWRRLVADPSHRSRVAGWRCRVSALAPFADLAAILDRATTAMEGEVLNGLLLLARSGDQLAART